MEMLKLIAMSYRTSWFRMSGVLMTFGDIELRIGPTEGAKRLESPSTKKLELMDLNGKAIYATVMDFRNSKIRKKGLSFLADDVLIRIGPQRDPLVIHPERVPVKSNVSE